MSAGSKKVAFLHFWTLRMRRGVETLVISLANELASRNVDVSIVTARQTVTPLVLPSGRVRVMQLPTFHYYEFATIAPFYAIDLMRERYDVVVVFFADFGEGAALSFASIFMHPRLILYLTFPYESAPHRYQEYERWGFGRRAASILADAEYTAQRGEIFFHRPVEVLPSGTDPNRFKPDPVQRARTRTQLGFNDQDVVLLNVAALEERKGAWRVIEALPEIRQHCPTVRYLILGEGAQKATLQRRVVELGLESNVIFAGTTADLPPYYNAADIFVMLPDAEAGSIACLEAMASGLPAVVSNVGGFSEVVSETSGRIVAHSDQETIVCAVVELARNPTLRAELGTAARAIVVEKFSWEKLSDQFVHLLERAS